MTSSVVPAEYSFVYETFPYQGLLDNSSTTGVIEVEGPAIITSAGSGSDNLSFSQTNIIDLMPTLLSSNDSLGTSAAFKTTGDSYPVMETRILSRTQDILGLPANSITVGANSASRGRSTVSIPDVGNLGLKFETVTPAVYKKTYQSYILNKDNSGRLYLMVVGSETDNTNANGLTYLNPASNNDSVDIFELPGRPLLINRRH
jgi:hypothetical protein